MSISNVVLFISKYSEVCKGVVQYIIYNKMQITIIPIDSAEARKMVLLSDKLKLYSVPTLLVERTDNSVQLFLGNEKIMAWLNLVVYRISNNTKNHANHKINENDYIPQNPQKRKLKKKKRNKSLEDFIELPTTISDEDDQNTSTGSEILDRENNSQIIEKIHPTKGEPKITGGLSTLVGNTSTTKPNIMEMASRMMLERNETLGYSENDKKY